MERTINLRWPSSCAACGSALAKGAPARWDGEAKAARCLSCCTAVSPQGTESTDERPAPEPSVTMQVGHDAGSPGASARREYERRAAREQGRKQAVVIADREWREQAKAERPVVGRVAAALTPKPVVGPESQATRAWKEGEAGERCVAEVLDGLDGVAVLHDRRVPGSRANIDHVAVGPAGVYVIDAKRYLGGVEKRNLGGWFRVDERLYVAGRDRTKLVTGVAAQVGVVRRVLGDTEPPAVHGVLCFVESEWPLLFRRPLRVRGVAAVWPQRLADLVMTAGPLEATAIAAVARRLSESLRPA